MRDRFGITQLVFDEERSPKAVYNKSLELGREDVIQIKGKVIKGIEKPNLVSGGIEILATELTVLNASKTLHLLLKIKPMGERNCGCNIVI